MALYHAALAIACGMAAQVVAVRFALPGIVLLLVTGVAIGPDVFGLLEPAVFGSARVDLVSLAVAIILFEGGLGLRRQDLRQQQRSLTMLLTAGAIISMVIGMLAARFILGMPWPTASLFGALMIVTGPTVVTPLLARLTLDRSVRELLISEGVLIDPVGAIVAIVALEYVVGQHGMWETAWLVVVRLGIGCAVGAAAGLLMAAVLRRGWIQQDLWNPVVLASVLLAATLASRVSAEAGLMTAVVQGIVMANTGLRELRRLREFNEEVTLLLLSFVFVLLAASLPLSEVGALGWPALLVVATLMWVGRPLAVFISTTGSTLSVRQRIFVSWICPRGIVAVSVAALFQILLTEAGKQGGTQLEALVFVTVAVTVTLQGFTARPVARLLGVDLPTLQGTIIIGADHFGRLLARLLTAHGRQVVLIDRNPTLCRSAETEGLPMFNGDALAVETLEEAGARYVDTVLAVTSNVELNTLVAHRVHNNFRAQRVLAMSDEPHRRHGERETIPFPGSCPAPDELNRRLGADRLQLVEYQVDRADLAGRRLDDLPYADGEFILLLHRRDRVFISSTDQTIEVGDGLLSANMGRHTRKLASLFTVVREVDPWHPEARSPEASV